MNKKLNINSPHLFNVQEAAEFIGVNAGTIRRWAYNKLLEGIKVGIRGDWRFTKGNLLKMVNANESVQLNVQEQINTSEHIVSNELQNTKQLLAPRLDWNDMSDSDHFVQFYESDAFLLDSLSKFIGMGLREGDFCLVVATETHRKGLEERLKSYGLDLIDAQIRGRFLLLDASDALAKFMVDKMPNSLQFMEIMREILSRANKEGQQVKIFGEMVALLWAEENQAGAIQLEKLWNDLSKSHLFSLYCAYPMHGFDREHHAASFTEIGTHHSRVIPTESYNSLPSPDDRLRIIAQLQQKAASLEAEVLERKKLEQQKDEFISIASHELKTPVTSLTAYTQVLEKRFRKNGNIQEAECLKRMEHQLGKLTKLISDLLDVSKVQAGKMMFTKEIFLLEPLVKEIVQQVQLISKKHTITIHNSTQVSVFGDKDRIGQIIINLLTNAIKYSPIAEKVSVYVLEEGNIVKISVKDFGIGIDKEHQEKIFQQFYQVIDPKDKTYPGLGIGLYISRQIAARHNGKITVQSSKGKGSVFSLVLPVRK